MSVDRPDEISLALGALMEAEREADIKEKELTALRNAVNDATSAVVQVYLDLYERLPVNVRNKIRHAINTTKAS